MALSSINKFSPYTPSGNTGLLMPKLQYRFRVLFNKFGGSYGLASVGGDQSRVLELTKQVVDVDRPSVNFNPVVLDTYNSKVNIAGKPSWSKINLTVRDDMGGNISRVVGEQVQKQFDFLEQASAAAAGDYKFLMTLDMLDGGNGAYEPGILESWEISGCFIDTVSYNKMDYKSSEAVTISMSVTFDNALQTDKSGSFAEGIGVAVGRTVGEVLSPF